VPRATKQRILQKAATLIGRDELARELKVGHAELEAWLVGSQEFPDTRLLALADLLASYTKK